MSFSFHPGAEGDTVGALDFYLEHAGPAVANRFLNEFERVAILLTRLLDLGYRRPKGAGAFL